MEINNKYISREEQNGLTQEYLNSIFFYKDGYLYWFFTGLKASTCSTKGRRIVRILGKSYLEHRIIFFIHKGYVPFWVDHEDRDCTNNLISNLRACNSFQNNANRAKVITSKTTSVYKGVSKMQGKEWWQSVIVCNNKRIFLGSYRTEQKAALTYNKAAIKYHGDFAWLNIIKP